MALFEIINSRVRRFCLDTVFLATVEQSEFKIENQIGFDAEKELVYVKINVFCTRNENESEERYMDLDVEFVFRVPDYSDFMEIKDDESHDIKKLPVLLSVLGVSLSTVRGILMEKGRGTFFEKKLLPILNPFDLLPAEFKSTL